jgi:hypothetical protein
MLESYPSYYWVVSTFVQPIRYIRSDMPKDLQVELVARAMHGCEMFVRYPITQLLLPRSTEKANVFHDQLIRWARALVGLESAADLGGKIELLSKTLDSFSISLQDELDTLPMFTVTKKGNLSIHSLVKGASAGYPKGVIELLDQFMKDDIDHAGKCIAFELPTSCGFHILRAVETGMKGYVHAATGKLPPIKNRNWGEYIEQLTKAGAHADLIDVLRMLKTKRNPLMHPTDNLDTDEAISLLCICQAGIEALIADVRRRSLEIKFKESLEKMPTL